MSELAKALADLQAELPKVGKPVTADTGAYKYQYAPLDLISEAVLPLLSKHGLSFTCCPTMSEYGFVLDYALTHSSGESKGGQYPLPDPSRTAPQQLGSAISYSRRYCLTAVTGIAPGGEDDDGKAAADARSQKPRQERLATAAWLDDMRTRIDFATTAKDLADVEKECTAAYNDGSLTGKDATDLRARLDNRKAELTAPVGAE